MIFDYSAKTFRSDLFDGYKANRTEPPDDLIPQFPLVRDAVRAFNVACIEQEGYEADDIIATYALQALEAGAEVTIVSSDKDLMQLVQPGIIMYDTMKNKVIGEAEVIERFGVPPSKVIEVQALMGDSSDNVPGVPGIGVKTAALLINEFGDLETLLARASEIKQDKRRESLITFADQARLSKALVILDTHVPVEIELAETAVRAPDTEALVGFLRKLEFSTLVRRIAEGLGAELPEGMTPSATPQRKKKDDYDHPLRRSPRGPAVEPQRKTEGGSPAQLAVERAGKLEDVPFDRANYETVTEASRLADLLDAARYQGHFAFRVKLNSADPMQGELVGVALALVPGHAAYVPLAHRAGDGLDLGGDGHRANSHARGARPAEAHPRGRGGAEDRAERQVRHGGAGALRHRADRGRRSVSDVLRARRRPRRASARAACGAPAVLYLPHRERGAGLRPQRGRLRPGAGGAAPPNMPARRPISACRLWLVLKPRLAAESVTTVYETLERPLSAVLALMERTGVKVERATLASLSLSFAQTIARLEDEIRELAGEDFNIGSPKQLGEILFDKMSLSGGRRTKTGAWSTDAAALEELAAEGHELPRKVLDWRLLAKLKSTYTDALPTYIHPETGRVHTSYALAATTTGRLSSVEPNLQNIPVRTPEGRSIRKAFVAEKGKKLISADYSQIELRVLAHMADTPTLRQAFADGLDIHAMTASEMFGVPIEGMDPGIRRKAKAINFGIIYGISSVGLAAQLGIGRSEAGAYIKTYFERFPGIRDYMEAMKAEARRTGYVKTLFGRKVHYPEINTKNPTLRGNYERAAINAPIQGSAADIIRRAMIRMGPALEAAGLAARMLMQVHDELVFEAPEDEVDKTMEVAMAVMEDGARAGAALERAAQGRRALRRQLGSRALADSNASRLDHGDDVGLHHALDLGQIFEHHLGAVLRRRAVELGHELLARQHHHIGEFAVGEAADL